jgi:hypothetical protein
MSLPNAPAKVVPRVEVWLCGSRRTGAGSRANPDREARQPARSRLRHISEVLRDAGYPEAAL